MEPDPTSSTTESASSSSQPSPPPSLQDPRALALAAGEIHAKSMQELAYMRGDPLQNISVGLQRLRDLHLITPDEVQSLSKLIPILTPVSGGLIPLAEARNRADTIHGIYQSLVDKGASPVAIMISSISHSSFADALAHYRNGGGDGDGGGGTVTGTVQPGTVSADVNGAIGGAGVGATIGATGGGANPITALIGAIIGGIIGGVIASLTLDQLSR